MIHEIINVSGQLAQGKRTRSASNNNECNETRTGAKMITTKMMAHETMTAGRINQVVFAK